MRLRRLAASDLAAFQSYRQDPEVGRWQGWTPWPDVRALAFLQEMASAPLLLPGTWSQLGVADETSDLLLGDVGLYVSEDGQAAELGFSLARAAQGRGLASAAVSAAVELLLTQTAVRHVHAQTDERNVRCIRLLERLGAPLIARIATEFRGEPCIELRYELARR